MKNTDKCLTSWNSFSSALLPIAPQPPAMHMQPQEAGSHYSKKPGWASREGDAASHPGRDFVLDKCGINSERYTPHWLAFYQLTPKQAPTEPDLQELFVMGKKTIQRIQSKQQFVCLVGCLQYLPDFSKAKQ